MFGLDNPVHLVFLLVILLLVFGAKRLPELGRSLGSGMRGFKESITGEGSAEGQAPAQALQQQAAPASSHTPPVRALD
jgi:sec-independent protein translocase protein TatA